MTYSGSGISVKTFSPGLDVRIQDFMLLRTFHKVSISSFHPNFSIFGSYLLFKLFLFIRAKRVQISVYDAECHIDKQFQKWVWWSTLTTMAQPVHLSSPSQNFFW